MHLEILDPAVAERLHRQMERSGAANADELLLRLLETQEEQDRWLSESRSEIDAKLARAIAQFEQGDCVHEDELDEWLAEHKPKIR